MKREIKFRAWDKDAEVMAYSDKHNKKDYECDYFFQQDDNGNICCYWECDYDDSFGYPSTSGGFLDNLMQYTGLKDKNGKEIYEGDIVRFEDTGEEGYEYKEGFEFENIAVVTYNTDKAAYTLSNFNEKENSYYANDGLSEIDGEFLSTCEVIGNLYDNQELLQEVE